MDPDLLAEYAMMGAGPRRNSQFLDGMVVDFSVSYGGKTFKQNTAMYSDGGTDWNYEPGLPGVKELNFHGYESVAFREIVIKALMDDGSSAVIFKEEHMKPGKTYKVETIVLGKAFKVTLKAKE